MTELQDRIEYHFHDLSLLETALTHSSYANEHPREHAECYERLELLGDSFLGLVTAEFLYQRKPQLPEGRMTRLRSELVCEASLHQTALCLGLGEHMLLGRGEANSGGRERPSILADMVEALIAALYLDGGMDVARSFILERILKDAVIAEDHTAIDYKTELQELVQQKPNRTIRYEQVSESGPDHNKRFSFRVSIDGVCAGEGTGRTKKEAEQLAARQALEGMKP